MSYKNEISAVQSAPASSAIAPTGRVSPRRLASNRRNALKSTGPRTKAGKYRSALNARKRGWCPEALERELHARGEDPREFCCLHRDLAAIFRPTDALASTAVELLARTWWQKARRLRQWVGAGVPVCPEIDARLDALLGVVVGLMRERRQPWKTRLAAVVGPVIGGRSETRRQIEGQLSLFRPLGGQPGRRRYEVASAGTEEALRAWIEDAVARLAAQGEAKAAVANEPNRSQQR